MNFTSSDETANPSPLGVTLVVHAARMGYAGSDALDITRLSGGRDGLAFAPSWSLVKPFLDRRKEGVLTDDDFARYTIGYVAEMRASYVRHRSVWDALLAREFVTLLCFCTNSAQCHRTLLGRDILPKFGAIYAGEIGSAKAPAPAQQLDLLGGVAAGKR